MKFQKIGQCHLSIILLLSSFMPIFSFNEAEFEQVMSDKSELAVKHDSKRDDDCSDCGSIKVNKIKAEEVYSRCIKARKVDAGCVDADHLRSDDISADKAYLASLCTQTICASQFVSNTVDAQSVTTNDLSVAGTTCLSTLNVLAGCISAFTANDACVSGTLRVNNLLNCGNTELLQFLTKLAPIH